MKNFLTTLFSILTPHEKAKLLTNSLFDFFIALLDIVLLACLILLVNFYNNTQGTHVIFIKNVFGSGAVLPAGLFLILFAIKNGFGYYVLKTQGTFFLQVASRLSERNLWQYLHGDYANFINNDSSVYIRKISQQPIEFSTYILTNLQQVISQIMLILLTVIGLLFYHSLLFLALFALLLPPVFIIAFVLKKKLMNVRANIKTTSQLTLQHVQESLSAFVESNIFIKHSFFVNRYKRFQQQLNNNIATQQNLQGLPARMMEVFAVFGLFMLVAIDRRSSQGGGAGFLDTGIFMATVYKIIPGIVKISNSLGQVKTYLFTLTELAEPATIAAEDTLPVPMVRIGSVNFHAVSFGYTSRQILTDFNL